MNFELFDYLTNRFFGATVDRDLVENAMKDYISVEVPLSSTTWSEDE